MRVIKNILGFVAIFIISGATLLPVSIMHKLWQGETIWIIQAIREMHPGIRLLPTLGHKIIQGQNPLNIILISFLPLNSSASYRFVFIPCAFAVITLVFIFCRTLWGTRSAVWASILLTTSYGFIRTYTSVNTVALPATLATIGIILFFLAYLNEYKSPWYIISYACISLATITGGWIFLAFGAITILLLVLFDLSPDRLLDAVPTIGIGILIICILGFYLTFRIATSSSAYVYNALSHGHDMGFLETLVALAKYTLPWIPLILPAWIHTQKSKDHEHWREALPSKIAFSTCIIVLWFSSRCEMEYAILAVPFSSIIIGNWVATDSAWLAPGDRLNKWALYLAGLGIFAYAGIILALSLIMRRSLDTREILSLVVLAGAGIALFISLLKKNLQLSLYLCVLSVIISTWIYSLCYVPEMDTRHNPENFIEELSNYSPVAVFEDDLITRAWIAYKHAGEPYLVRKNLEPVGGDIYLVFYAKRPKKLLRYLKRRMDVEITDTFCSERRFTLMKLSPI